MSHIDVNLYLNHAGFIHYTTVKKRARNWLSALILGSYIIYVYCMTFEVAFMSKAMGEDTVMTVGMIFSIGMILSGIIFSGLYTYWANRMLDRLKQEILEEFGHE
jgi:uncharacterized membrane protein (DUF485 family)